MAYPFIDPLKLTFAVFEMYHSKISDTKKWMNDNWNDEDVIRWKAGRDNRRMTWQHYLPSYYLDPFSDEYHEKMFAEPTDDETPVFTVELE